MPQERAEKRIDELPILTNEWLDEASLPTEQGGVAYQVPASRLKQYVTEGIDQATIEAIVNTRVGEAVSTAQNAASSASDSADSAEANATAAQNANEAIQAFDVRALLVNTESDFGVVKTVDPNTGAVTLTFKNLKGRDGGAVIGQTLDSDGMYVNEINTVNAVWTGGSY